MRIVDLLHRWTGALLGLLLAVLGLSGALLLWKRWWVPGASGDLPGDSAALLEAAARLKPGYVLLGSEDFALTRIGRADGSGAYLDGAGAIVAQWGSPLERPELWLFELHHKLLAGETGETVTGFLGLAAIVFVVTGLILWWRTRATFAPRLWPKRLSRPSILRHHRDLGVMMAPLLLLAALTGSMMVLKPLGYGLLAPLSAPGAIAASLKPPQVQGGRADAVDMHALLATANRRFPEAEARMLVWPRKPGDLMALRMRQPAEWHPNGRTTLWFDAATGRLVEARDALAMPTAPRAYNALYPLHSAAVGGFALRLAMTAAGLALALLGTLTVWSFWTGRPKARRAAAA
jgi:uncharacterized iron-regulated membrane protein